MKNEILRRAASLVRLAALAACVICGTHSVASLAQDETGPNIIVTNDAPGVERHGSFQGFASQLSRSRSPLRSAGTGNHDVSFRADITVPGYYRAFVWWPAVSFAAGVVHVTVHGLSADAVVLLDQGLRTGQWVPIGIFQFGHSAQLTLSGGPGATVVADAVRFRYMGPRMPALAFDTEDLPLTQTGDAYNGWFDVVGGTAPYTFAVDPNALPPGLVLDGNTGTITGIASKTGTYPFDVEVFDHSGQRAVKRYTIEVFPGFAVPKSTLAKDGGNGKAVAKPSLGRTIKDGLPAGAAPDLSSLLGLLAAIPEGEWVRANLNAYSDVWSPPDLRPLYGLGNPAPYKIILAWSSVAWDPNRGDLWLFGGGHANYPGNDVYRWRGSTRMWERASLPSEIKQDDLGNWQAVDGWDNAPASAHTYDNNMFFPHIDRFIAFGGAAFNSGGAWRREVTTTSSRLTGPFFFDPSRADPNKVGGTTGSHVMRVAPHPEIVGGNMWSNRDMFVNIPNFPVVLSQVNGCTAYADENGKDVAYIGARSGGGTSTNLYKFTVNDLSNPALDTFQTAGIFWNGTAAMTVCAIDPVHKVLLRTGTNAVPFVYWNLASPGVNNKDARATVMDPTGEFGSLLASNALSMQNCGLDFDPVRSAFVLWCGDGRVWAITPPSPLAPTGWTIVKQPLPALATPNGDVGTGILGKWKYVSNLDAFIGVQDQNLGNIWLYKPIGWTNPSPSGPPAAPMGVAASDGTSTSNVVVTWTASASATSYTVYRSASVGSKGTSIGTTTNTSFTDKTAVPGTVYYYGVTATGAGGEGALSQQDSGYAAAIIGGGALAGAPSLPLKIDLTSVGPSDWIHWLPVNRKLSGSLISDYVPVGTGTVTAYFDDARTFTWSNGTPNAAGNDSAGATTTGVGAGFSFSVAAGTAPRTILVYVGGTNSTGRLTAHLSDASAPDYVDVSISGSARYDGLYTLTFHAASEGQQLQITWTQAAGAGSISLQAAALQ